MSEGFIKNSRKVTFIIILSFLLAFSLKAQDGVSTDLEEINISDSLNKTDDSSSDVTPGPAEPAVTEKKTESSSTAEELKELESLSKIDPAVEGISTDSATPATPAESSSSSDTAVSTPEPVKMSTIEEQDDLSSLKEDIGEVVFEKKPLTEEEKKTDTTTLESDEKLLKELASQVKKKQPNADWWELSHRAKIGKYEVQKGEDLISISKKLFGTDIYYSKIWALNPQITNPYEVEPGTILSFDMGTIDGPPSVQVGEFAEQDALSDRLGSANAPDESKTRQDWIQERKKLIDQGVYFQFASEETYEDLIATADEQKKVEYESYSPPVTQFTIAEPSAQYDETGFDKSSRIVFNYKEGFFLNSFVTTNMLQDLGEVKAAINEGVFIHKHDTIYVSFDKSVKVKPGDMFSVYTAGGEIKHRISDRSGFLYTTTAQIKAMKKIDDLWECYVTDQSGVVQRKDRVTVYTPRIGKIAKTYSQRKVEAAIIGSYRESTLGLSYGDVVYLDRGRADGLELGNTFELFSFVDRGTEKKITPSPTYKIGELNIINLTDNFSTAVISASSHEINVGAIAFVKTQEEAARAMRRVQGEKTLLQKNGKALEELDVELNLDDVNQDILNKADRIQLTEDEIEELDRQERDKSIIKDKERDVKELDRLESEILDTEKSLNESKVDEDKFLEQQSLEDHEKKAKEPDPNAFESINEIEKDVGRKYLDEDLNSKENPYGLTEYDLEEVDLLLNTGPKK